jgi:hypothetical protein
VSIWENSHMQLVALVTLVYLALGFVFQLAMSRFFFHSCTFDSFIFHKRPTFMCYLQYKFILFTYVYSFCF